MLHKFTTASNKVAKCVGLSTQGEFIPIEVESRGPINRDALQQVGCIITFLRNGVRQIRPLSKQQIRVNSVPLTLSR